MSFIAQQELCAISSVIARRVFLKDIFKSSACKLESRNLSGSNIGRKMVVNKQEHHFFRWNCSSAIESMV
jgi:hypothetical protein